MTLLEVVIALFLITAFAASAFGLVLNSYKRTLSMWYRLEAYSVSQTVAEHAMQVAFPASFTVAGVTADADTGTGTAWRWSATEPSMLRTSAQRKVEHRWRYLTGAAPVVFTKRLTAHPVPPSDPLSPARVLIVTVSWRFSGHDYSVSMPIVRGV